MLRAVAEITVTNFLSFWAAIVSTSSIIIATAALRLALRKEKRDAARIVVKPEIGSAPDGGASLQGLLVTISNEGRGALQIRKLLANSKVAATTDLPRKLHEGQDWTLFLPWLAEIPGLKTLCVEDSTGKRWWAKNKDIRALQKELRKREAPAGAGADAGAEAAA